MLNGHYDELDLTRQVENAQMTDALARLAEATARRSELRVEAETKAAKQELAAERARLLTTLVVAASVLSMVLRI